MKNYKINTCEFYPEGIRTIRFIIQDEKGNILDDAGGYGFKNKQKAEKAAWYKFSGGKSKINNIKNWWKTHKEFHKKVDEYYEWAYKEIANGERETDEDILEIAQEMKINDFDIKYLKYFE